MSLFRVVMSWISLPHKGSSYPARHRITNHPEPITRGPHSRKPLDKLKILFAKTQLTNSANEIEIYILTKLSS